jgi:hypothetical protein
MASKYFNNDTAGNVYNQHFISFKEDAEKGETIELAKKYQVKGYPTIVFINPLKESIVYKTVGCPSALSGFLRNAEVALMEKK